MKDYCFSTSGYTPKGLKSVSGSDICTPMFTAALFTIDKIGEQPKCLLTGEWIKKMWQTPTHTGILLNLKKNEILPFA